MIEDPPAKQTKCSNCGGTDFEWGWGHHWGYYTFLRYRPLAKYNFFGVQGNTCKLQTLLELRSDSPSCAV